MPKVCGYLRESEICKTMQEIGKRAMQETGKSDAGNVSMKCSRLHSSRSASPLPSRPQMSQLRPGTLPAGFIAPCLPTSARQPSSGPEWLMEIKHDGFRVIA